ncbi:MAG: helix-turn-helix transcriptional regulator [Planctomycetaceae bacterium]|jgi:ribosome-binding protein aMBF1 (putative translation factor)|nr:helix-turn-helix transcriptional regulator [Planctomycetaceae bacterium]MBT6486118.1 helix-turn-helix transcriptional regulator [Planctomycetaceae bacterium]MBT6494351.1 helix-turn-helix transcriptional regulator [Planctomycetaceae bacterium]
MSKRKSQQSPRTVRLRNGIVIEFRSTEDVMDYGQALRDAIEESGLSQYHLSKLTGIAQSALSKFFAGGEINLLTFQKLANLMGFEIRQNPDKSPRKP